MIASKSPKSMVTLAELELLALPVPPLLLRHLQHMDPYKLHEIA
jgi:hypothetical protein